VDRRRRKAGGERTRQFAAGADVEAVDDPAQTAQQRRRRVGLDGVGQREGAAEGRAHGGDAGPDLVEEVHEAGRAQAVGQGQQALAAGVVHGARC